MMEYPEKHFWSVVRTVRLTRGFNLGLLLYTFNVFLYDHFGGDAKALKLIVALVILSNIFKYLFEIPTGAYADLVGRKRTVILTFAAASLSYFFRGWIFFTPSLEISYLLALLGAIFYAISFTLFSGSFNAWMVDSIREMNLKGGHSPLLARSFSIASIGELFGAALGLLLYLSDHIYLAFFLGIASSLICIAYCSAFMLETKSENLSFYKGRVSFQASKQRMKSIVLNGGKIGLGTPVLLFITLMHAAFMFLIHTINYLWPIAMKTNYGAGKMSLYWYFIVFAGTAMAYFGSKLIEYLNRRETSNTGKDSSSVSIWKWYATTAFFAGLSILVLGFSKYFGEMFLLLFVVIIILSQFAYGFVVPAYTALINNYIPVEHSKERATILSFGSMLISLIVALLLYPSSGSNGQETMIGWMIPGGLVMGFVLVFNVFIRNYQRKIGEISNKNVISNSLLKSEVT